MRHPRGDAVSALVTPLLDAAAIGLARFHSEAWALSRPARRPFLAYLRWTGLEQPWSMFSNPPLEDQYLRLRYHVHSISGRAWAATELVLPAAREDRVRLIRSYGDSYRDKALAVAIQDFDRHSRSRVSPPDGQPRTPPDDLAPVARYFARAFERRALRAGEQVVRTEVWVGFAPARPQGSSAAGARARRDRARVLRLYYEGPIEHRLGVPPMAPRLAVDTEADIRWVLEYVEEQR